MEVAPRSAPRRNRVSGPRRAPHHRPAPEGWDAEAPFHFVDSIEAAVTKAQDLAGDRIIEFAAGDVGGQHLLEDPEVVVQGNRVLHLRYRVRTRPI